MGILRVSLFGGVRVSHDDWQIDTKLTPTIQGLFAYLLLHNQRLHSREALAGLFWGDYSQKRARGCLNTALWRLRRVLEPDGIQSGTFLITTSLNEIGFNCESPHWLDVEIFTDQVKRVVDRAIEQVDHEDIKNCEQAIQLYTGDLLEGIYDDWAIRQREHLRLVYVKSLIYLMKYYKSSNNYEKSLLYAQKILDLDPLREEIHREAMYLYMMNDQRAMAVRQFEICSELLWKELRIRPMEKTLELYDSILQETKPEPDPGCGAASKLFSLQEGLEQLRLAVQSFDRAREQFQRAVQFFEFYVKDQSDHPRRSKD